MSKGILAIAGLLSILILLAPLVSAYNVVQQEVTLNGDISQSAANTAIVTGSNNNVNQAISQTAVSKYSQYYTMPDTMPEGQASKTHIKAPQKQDTKSKIPTTVYFGYQMQAVPYSQYKTYAAYTGGNSLWIEGATSWTQYAVVPQGASLSLLAASLTGGNGYLYEIAPNGKLNTNSYYFYPYNYIGFYADTIGKHILLFIIDGQVSNSLVIDVVSYSPWSQQPIQPQPYIPPATYMPGTTPAQTSGDTPVIISSQGMRGYQVFLDGNYIGTEGMGGDPLDGRFSFRVAGDQYHDIRVYDGQFNYPKSMFFQRGVQKIIYVEPGTAVYI